MKPEEIRTLRLKLGWTQEQFATKLGVSKTTVYNWEKGNFKPLPTFKTRLERLAKRVT